MQAGLREASSGALPTLRESRRSVVKTCLHHYQHIKGIFKDHAGNLLILDPAQQDEIAAKATQRESR